MTAPICVLSTVPLESVPNCTTLSGSERFSQARCTQWLSGYPTEILLFRRHIGTFEQVRPTEEGTMPDSPLQTKGFVRPHAAP